MFPQIYGILSAGEPQPIIFDQFTAADGTLLDGRLPAPINNGNAWSVPTGTYDIISNRARFLAGGSGQRIAAVNGGVANCKISCITRWTNYSGNAGIAFRGVDVNNFWFLYLTSLSGGELRIFERTGGSNTVRAAAAFTQTTGIDYALELELSGDVIAGRVVGGPQVTFTSSVRNTATPHGLGASATENALFDDWKLEP